MERPNVVVFTCHDLGDFLGCYGHPISTPTIDSLASDGVCFQNHFSTSTVCSPARGAIMTGRYPHANGLMGLVHRGWELDVDKQKTLPMVAAAAGYDTHLFGFQHEHPQPSRLGYHEVHQCRSHEIVDVAQSFTDWIERRDISNGPFWAAVGTNEVHRVGLPSSFLKTGVTPANPQEIMVPPWLPDCPEVRGELADFYGLIGLMDEYIGRILEAIRRKGIDRNTLFIFTTDHGASFTHGKATVYDGGTKVAMLMRWPDGLPKACSVEELTSHVDMMQTLCELLEMECPSQVQGQSFAACAKGERVKGREFVFSQKNYTNYFDPTRTIRSRTHRYICKGLRTCVYDFMIPEIEQHKASFKDSKIVRDFYSSTRYREELYDIRKDPGELVNVIDDPANGAILKQMKSALENHMHETGDPFKDFCNEILMPAVQRGASWSKSRNE